MFDILSPQLLDQFIIYRISFVLQQINLYNYHNKIKISLIILIHPSWMLISQYAAIQINKILWHLLEAHNDARFVK